MNTVTNTVGFKPSWESAPSWAKWLAMDANGTWFWYKNKPSLDGDYEWYTSNQESFGGFSIAMEIQQTQEQRSINSNVFSCEISLEMRPKN